MNFLKLVLRVPKTVLKNKKLVFKNRLKHLKRNCFGILKQKQSCSHKVKKWKMVVRTEIVLFLGP